MSSPEDKVCKMSFLIFSTCGFFETELNMLVINKSSCFSTFLSQIRPNSKAGHDYERLKLQCMKAMADLQSLQNQHSTTLKRCEEAVKKADFYQWVGASQTPVPSNPSSLPTLSEGPVFKFLAGCAFAPCIFLHCLQDFPASGISVCCKHSYSADWKEKNSTIYSKIT